MVSQFKLILIYKNWTQNQIPSSIYVWNQKQNYLFIYFLKMQQ
jgi:hypothetical protein